MFFFFQKKKQKALQRAAPCTNLVTNPGCASLEPVDIKPSSFSGKRSKKRCSALQKTIMIHPDKVNFRDFSACQSLEDKAEFCFGLRDGMWL
jgi:hypothetical protein